MTSTDLIAAGLLCLALAALCWREWRWRRRAAREAQRKNPAGQGGA